tara:strand:+ start:1164 stop:1307 length:144 start_codon:yes stop_codon:yes gene_type:complete
MWNDEPCAGEIAAKKLELGLAIEEEEEEWTLPASPKRTERVLVNCEE